MFVMALSYLYIQIIHETLWEKDIFLEIVYRMTDSLEFGTKYFLFLLV